MRVFCPKCQDVFWPSPQFESSSVIDAAAFTAKCGQSLPMMLLKAYPELIPEEGRKPYFPTICGFRIATLVGSKYEYKYDNNGNCLNKKEIDKILAKPKPPPVPPKKIDYTKLITNQQV